MDQDDNKKAPSLFEQHAQTIATGLTLAMVVGAGTLLLTMRDDISGMKSEIRFMGEQLKNAGDDRFRGADWRQQKAILDERFYELKSQVRDLEKRMDEAERLNQKFHVK